MKIKCQLFHAVSWWFEKFLPQFISFNAIHWDVHLRYYWIVNLEKICLFINITRHKICVSISSSHCDSSHITSIDSFFIHFHLLLLLLFSIQHPTLIIAKIPWIDEFANGFIVCLKRTGRERSKWGMSATISLLFRTVVSTRVMRWNETVKWK